MAIARDTYGPKVFRERGGDRLVVKSGGSIENDGAVFLSTGGRTGPGFKSFLEEATSSFATLVNYGITKLRASGAVTMPLAAPVAGVQKWITIIAAGGTVTITSSSAGADLSTAGSTQISVTSGTNNFPSFVHLMGLNSTRWLVLGLGSSANISIS
jgi:hypothetical protein